MRRAIAKLISILVFILLATPVIAALPGDSCVPYEGGIDAIVDEASTFILRGIGVRDAAIAAADGASERALETAAD